jgi:hypothetical protein
MHEPLTEAGRTRPIVEEANERAKTQDARTAPLTDLRSMRGVVSLDPPLRNSGGVGAAPDGLIKRSRAPSWSRQIERRGCLGARSCPGLKRSPGSQ